MLLNHLIIINGHNMNKYFILKNIIYNNIIIIIIMYNYDDSYIWFELNKINQSKNSDYIPQEI